MHHATCFGRVFNLVNTSNSYGAKGCVLPHPRAGLDVGLYFWLGGGSCFKMLFAICKAQLIIIDG